MLKNVDKHELANRVADRIMDSPTYPLADEALKVVEDVVILGAPAEAPAAADVSRFICLIQLRNHSSKLVRTSHNVREGIGFIGSSSKNSAPGADMGL